MAVYKTAVIQSAESALKELQKTPYPGKNLENKRKQKEFEEQPEVQAFLREIQEKTLGIMG